MHQNQLYFRNFDSKTLYLVKEKNTEELKLLICDMETLDKSEMDKGE